MLLLLLLLLLQLLLLLLLNGQLQLLWVELVLLGTARRLPLAAPVRLLLLLLLLNGGSKHRHVKAGQTRWCRVRVGLHLKLLLLQLEHSLGSLRHPAALATANAGRSPDGKWLLQPLLMLLMLLMHCVLLLLLLLVLLLVLLLPRGPACHVPRVAAPLLHRSPNTGAHKRTRASVQRVPACPAGVEAVLACV